MQTSTRPTCFIDNGIDQVTLSALGAPFLRRGVGVRIIGLLGDVMRIGVASPGRAERGYEMTKNCKMRDTGRYQLKWGDVPDPARRPRSLLLQRLFGVTLISLDGGNGDTLETAVVVRGARGALRGIPAEYLSQRFGKRGVDWQLLEQNLFEADASTMIDFSWS